MDTVDSENFTSPKTGQISLDLNSKAKTPMKEDESPEDLGEEFVQTLSVILDNLQLLYGTSG